MAKTGDKDSKMNRVSVLAGGPSSEREISLKSGKAVYDALIDGGVDAALIDIGDDVNCAIQTQDIGAAFIALHGGFGEDGTIQAMLEELNIPYTGSGPKASRLALDKLASRMVFQEIGIDVPRFKALKRRDAIEISGLTMPLVVKPKREGSSIGLTKVKDRKGLNTAIEEAFKYDDEILIEEFIKGRELTVGILDEKPLPVIEIVTKKGHYDYRAKYESPDTRYLVPAPLKIAVAKKAQDAGIRAHSALGCRSFSRVDMILGEDNKIYVLEVNTIPGLTSRSLLPKAAEAAGISFIELCKRILKGALK